MAVAGEAGAREAAETWHRETEAESARQTEGPVVAAGVQHEAGVLDSLLVLAGEARPFGM